MSSFALIQVVFLNTMGFVLTFVLFLSLLCNFNAAIFFKETLNLFLQTQIGKIKISIYRESFFSSFFSVTKQSICMKQCHLHLPCGYSLIPVKGNFEKQCIWTFGVCMKNQNFFFTSNCKCSSSISIQSIFVQIWYKNGVTSETIYPIIYNAPIRWWNDGPATVTTMKNGW